MRKVTTTPTVCCLESVSVHFRVLGVERGDCSLSTDSKELEDPRTDGEVEEALRVQNLCSLSPAVSDCECLVHSMTLHLAALHNLFSA